MEKKLFFMVMLINLLVFTLLLASCDTGSGTDTNMGGRVVFTITQIPAQYIGERGWLTIVDMGTVNYADITGTSATFVFSGNIRLPPGRNSDIVLRFGQHFFYYNSSYRVLSRRLNWGDHSISFHEFEPSTIITITEIPNQYRSGNVTINLWYSGTWNWSGFSGTQTVSPWSDSSEPFVFWGLNTGLYDITLQFGSGEIQYRTLSRIINTGANNIPFNIFSPFAP